MNWIRLIKLLAVITGVWLFCFLFGFVLNCIFSHSFRFVLDLGLLLNNKTLTYAFLLFGATLLIWLMYYYKHFWLKHSKRVMEGNKGDRRIDVNLEQARFQTDREIDRNFAKVEFKDLPQKDIAGIPVRARQSNKGYTINLAKNAHTMIIGTTGSGKTTSFINPSVQILSESAAKPSMLISDPKGELYALHAASLKNKGYEVKVLDLRNPFNSIRWNPLERPYLMYQRMLHLEDEVTADEENGCYIFEEQSYFRPDELKCAVQVKKQQLYDQVYEDLHDMVTVLCPITNKNEPIWESGAKNFILAIAIAMLEDSAESEPGMTVDKYNFYNLTKIATNTENDCEELIKYFQGRGNLSKSLSLSKQVLDSAEKTRGSYLSTMFDKLNMFADLSLCSLTASNELTFANMAERPVALFLQIPDEKETRHTLASMVLLQAYKELVQKANTYPELSLPRCVYFLLDEFGQLPPIHKLEQMITVGRSRNIWLCLVIQSYAQLAKVYDDKVAEIIKSNCNIQIFIGTADQKTIEDYSKRCGNYSVITRNVGYNTVKADDINSNASIKERPLIYPSELAQLNRPGNMGNAIVTVFGYMPIRSKFTPSFECSTFKLEPSAQRLNAGRYFDEVSVFYDMKRRNRLLAPVPGRVPSRRGGGAKLVRQMDGVIEIIKEQAERAVKPELLSNEEKIRLLNLIDKKEFLKAKEIIVKTAARAAALNEEHLIEELESLCQKLAYMDVSVNGNVGQKQQ